MNLNSRARGLGVGSFTGDCIVGSTRTPDNTGDGVGGSTWVLNLRPLEVPAWFQRPLQQVLLGLGHDRLMRPSERREFRLRTRFLGTHSNKQIESTVSKPQEAKSFLCLYRRTLLCYRRHVLVSKG